MTTLRAPGMRTIKTALIVAICLLVSKLLNLKYPYYGAIAAIICTQSTLHGSFEMSKNRIIGTLIGSFVGVIFVYAFSYNPLTSGVGVLILVYFLNIINLEGALRVSCIVYLATFIPGHGPSIQYGVDRTIATIIGILIALAVNTFVSPPKYSNDIKKFSYNLVDELLKACGDFFIYGKQIELSKVGKEILKIQDLSKNYKLDSRKGKVKEIDIDKIDLLVLDSKRVYNHLGIIQELYKSGCKFNLNNENARFVSEIYNQKIVKNINNENEDSYLDEVFNYHVNELKKHLVHFKEISSK